MKLSRDVGSGFGGRGQTAKKAAAKKHEVAKKKAVPKKNEPGFLPCDTSNDGAFERAGM